jgi:hypothetical protein
MKLPTSDPSAILTQANFQGYQDVDESPYGRPTTSIRLEIMTGAFRRQLG